MIAQETPNEVVKATTEEQRKEIKEAIAVAEECLINLRKAHSKLVDAKDWGNLDMLGGGLFSSYKKHSKIDSAKKYINLANRSIEKLNLELKDVKKALEFDGLLKFSDFGFDNFFVDFKVQRQIKDAKKKCLETINQVKLIKEDLESRL